MSATNSSDNAALPGSGLGSQHSSTPPVIHSSPLQILRHYWRHSAFRPLQENIIASVLSGNDTLALLPTGGGKSICFQVPAMAMPGLCLVVSPLIALMKDQVEQLQKRGIKAVGVFSGMHRREIDIALDNCVYGDTKFLYVSPERLKTDMFLARVPKMKVALLAIDEAHCISQWGYDFRPPYLQIADLRELLPKVPVIALTATATEEVKEDIKQKLQFRPGHQTFQQSFARKNLSYSCLDTEDKHTRLLQILKNVPGTAIVYVRSRNRTADIARWLQQQGIKAAHYHAGLQPAERSLAQDNWINNRTRVIVATNAFGMGIDKPDVRVVVHLDLPDTLEAYYQEAGRAGRDERYSYAVLLFAQHDIDELRKRVEQANPPLHELKRVYQALANYYQVAVGSGAFQSFPFVLEEFAAAFKMKPMDVHHALKKLEMEGLLQLNAGYHSPSRMLFTTDKMALYEYQVANPSHDVLIRMILRMQGGEAFTNFIRISERALAAQLKVQEPVLKQQLEAMQKAGILLYHPQTDQPQLVYTTPRQDADKLSLNQQRLAAFARQAQHKAEAVINYITQTRRCRTQLLLEYFGELTDARCRICDFCLAARKAEKPGAAEIKHERILTVLKASPALPQDLLRNFEPREHAQVLETVKLLLDAGKLKYDEKGRVGVTA